jgi:catalase
MSAACHFLLIDIGRSKEAVDAKYFCCRFRGFRVLVQLANEGDVVDDATVHWPEDRTQFELGTIALTALVPDSAHEQKQIIFDPIPRVEGIDPSDDPLLELRAAIYLISGRRRRAAPEK